MAKIKIKKATVKDIDKFFEFFKKSLNTQFSYFPPKVRRFFLKKQYTKDNFKFWIKRKATLLLAFYDKEIIGYLFASAPYGGISHIIWLAVSPSFQRKGIGTALLEKFEKIAKNQGCHKISLSTARKENITFYKKKRI